MCSLGLVIGVTSVASGGNRHSLNTRARDYLTGRLVCGGRLRGWAGGPVTPMQQRSKTAAALPFRSTISSSNLHVSHAHSRRSRRGHANAQPGRRTSSQRQGPPCKRKENLGEARQKPTQHSESKKGHASSYMARALAWAAGFGSAGCRAQWHFFLPQLRVAS